VFSGKLRKAERALARGEKKKGSLYGKKSEGKTQLNLDSSGGNGARTLPPTN